MIKKLTKKQESKIEEYYNKWYKVGHEYVSIDKQDSIKNILEYVSIIDIKPKYFLFFDSPMACELAINIIKNLNLYSQLSNQLRSQLDSQLDSQLSDQLYSQLSDQLYSQLSNQLRSQLDSQLDSQFRDQLYSQLSDQLYSQLSNQLRSQLDGQLSSQLRDQLDSQLRRQLYSQLSNQLRDQLYRQLYSQLSNQLSSQLYDQLDSQLGDQLDSQLGRQLGRQLDKIKLEHYKINWWTQCGNIMSGYCAFYDFIESEIISLDKKTKKIWENFKKVHELHYIFVFKDFVFISEKPKYLKFKDNILHNESGPAVFYKDGYSLWSLNGVVVNEYIVMTPANEIDCNIILKEKNAEIRKEIIKKVGINRVIDQLGAKSISKDGVYELLNFDCIDDRFRPYLKMINPSTGDYHIEGVHPDCDTIEKALAWRNNLNEYSNPIILT